MSERVVDKLKKFLPFTSKETSIPSFKVEHGRLSRANPEHPFANEDRILILPSKRLYGVFDGLQGLPYGEEAAEVAKNATSEYALEHLKIANTLEEAIWTMKQTMLFAHKAVVRLGGQKGVQCGTTCVLGHVYEHSDGTKDLIIGHVGDSRAYGSRSNQLKMLTIDHLYGLPHMDAEEDDKTYNKRIYDLLIKLGNTTNPADELQPEELELYKNRNIIYQHLGADYNPSTDIGVYSFKPGDIFFLCSDGTTDNLTHDGMQQLIEANPDLTAQELAEKLCDTAFEASLDPLNQRGKPDDISVVVITTSKR